MLRAFSTNIVALAAAFGLSSSSRGLDYVALDGGFVYSSQEDGPFGPHSRRAGGIQF